MLESTGAIFRRSDDWPGLGKMAAKTTVSGTTRQTPAAALTIGDAAAMLGPDGPVARALPGFTVRPRQQDMAERVMETLTEGGILISEAGTGTGKTLAYLAPVLMHGGKVVISTGTRTLQDQLFHRDIPLVRKALASPARVAMLKGRANYLCLHRFDEAERAAGSRDERLAEVRAWLPRTYSGELSELPSIPDDDPLRHQLSSTTDNCLGQQCPQWSDCHVVKARQRAQDADVLVINHHLLFSDILLRDEGYGELLPDSASFVIDEAHQLPELASDFFGVAVGGRQLSELARDIQRALRALGGDMPQVEQAARQLERTTDGFRRALGGEQRQIAWREIVRRRGIGAAVSELLHSLDQLDQQLEDAAARDKSLDNCRRRNQAVRARLRLFTGDYDATDDESTGERIHWVECTRRSFVLRMTPMDFADTFRAAMSRYDGAWIFTSATLAVGGDFTHFSARLGITDAATAQWDSPFDYAGNALLYLPEGLPEPAARGFTAAAVDAMGPVLEASGGRAFVLFTSHRALQEAAAIFARRSTAYQLLVQGTLPHSELLERFRAAGNAVLLGTASFWEGVDVRGPALSCVIIDKLPFAPPDDPVLQARSELIRARGGNPFRDYQLPNAIVALKQGVGRLIRAVDDRGVLMLCDPRLMTRPYGRSFLRDLPPMRRARGLADVAAFFTDIPLR
jgi:ATP-dependent DNA helicase DinG